MPSKKKQSRTQRKRKYIKRPVRPYKKRKTGKYYVRINGKRYYVDSKLTGYALEKFILGRMRKRTRRPRERNRSMKEVLDNQYTPPKSSGLVIPPVTEAILRSGDNSLNKGTTKPKDEKSIIDILKLLESIRQNKNEDRQSLPAPPPPPAPLPTLIDINDFIPPPPPPIDEDEPRRRQRPDRLPPKRVNQIDLLSDQLYQVLNMPDMEGPFESTGRNLGQQLRLGAEARRRAEEARKKAEQQAEEAGKQTQESARRTKIREDILEIKKRIAGGYTTRKDKEFSEILESLTNLELQNYLKLLRVFDKAGITYREYPIKKDGNKTKINFLKYLLDGISEKRDLEDLIFDLSNKLNKSLLTKGARSAEQKELEQFEPIREASQLLGAFIPDAPPPAPVLSPPNAGQQFTGVAPPTPSASIEEAGLRENKGITQADGTIIMPTDPPNPDDEEKDEKDDGKEEAEDIDKEIEGMEGKGEHCNCKKNDKGLYDYEIDNVMRNFKNFIGAIPIDQLAERAIKFIRKDKNKNRRFGAVVNLSPSYAGDGGSHWVAVYIDDRNKGSKAIEYYDPLAEEPPNLFFEECFDILNVLKPSTMLKLKINYIQDQHPESYLCGYHCILFLMKRFNDVPFKFASKFYNNSGEIEAERLKKKIHKFGFI